MDPEETIETIVQLDRYTWDWVDIGGTGVQVRLDASDPPVTFRFRPSPNRVRHPAGEHMITCGDLRCTGCL